MVTLTYPNDQRKLTPLRATLKCSHAYTSWACVEFLTDPVWPGLFYKHLRHSLIQSVSHPFPPNFKTSSFPNRISSLQVSHVTCIYICFFFFTKWRILLVEGLLSTLSVLSSFVINPVLGGGGRVSRG